MELIRVKIKDVKVPDIRVTSRFDPEKWEQFKSAMKISKELDPILIYDVDGDMILCDGLHRLIEAKDKFQEDILAVVVPGDMVDVITGNLMFDHLRGKHPVSEMVQVVGLLWNEHQMDSEAIAARTGMTRDYVEKLQKISQLTPMCLEALDQENIGVGAAELLTKLPTPELQETALRLHQLYRWKIPELKEYINMTLEQLAQIPPPGPGQDPPPPPKIRCNFCRSEYDLGQISNPNVCIHCAGIMFEAIATAEREVKSAGSDPDNA